MRDRIGDIKVKTMAFHGKVLKMLEKQNSPIIMRHLVLLKKLFEFLVYIAQIIEEKTGENDMERIEVILRRLQLEIFEFEPFCPQRFNGGYFYTHVEEMAHRK